MNPSLRAKIQKLTSEKPKCFDVTSKSENVRRTGDNQIEIDIIPQQCPESYSRDKLINWVDGNPIPAEGRVFTEQNIKDLAKCAASMKYSEEDDALQLYPELYGLSYMEVSLIKLAQTAAEGHLPATEMLLDRTIGRPKQTTENKNLNMTYQDLLDSIENPPGVN
jgi:hypothetical protein